MQPNHLRWHRMLVWRGTFKRFVYNTDHQIVQCDGCDVTSYTCARLSFLSERPGGIGYAALLRRINGVHLRLHDLGSKGAEVSADKSRTGLDLHIFWATVDTDSAVGGRFWSAT